MSLNDWHTILNDLSELVQHYVVNPFRKPNDVVRQIDGTNFELHVKWQDMDALLYSKLLSSLDFDLVFPFVMKIKVLLCSNVDKFIPNARDSIVSVPDTSPTSLSKKPAKKKAAKKMTNDTNSHSPDVSQLTNGHGIGPTIKLKECCVRLPMLQFDENGEVIQNQFVRNKRKHSSIAADEAQPVENSPNKIMRNNPNDLFVFPSSSTPLEWRSYSVALKQIENDVRETFDIPDSKAGNRLTTTPRISNDRKSSQFNPRIRLLKLPENVNRLKKSKKQKEKDAEKKAAKAKLKANKTTKKPKPKAQSVANESELFEKPVEQQKVKKSKTKSDPKKSPTRPSAEPEIVKSEER